MDLRTGAQGLVCIAQGRIVTETLVERVGGVKVIIGGRSVGANQVVIVVAVDLAGEHILARVLVIAIANKALFVAIVDHRHAAGKVHQGVGQLAAGQLLRIGLYAVVHIKEPAKTPAVMVAEEGGQAIDIRVRISEVVVIAEEIAQEVRGPILRDIGAHLLLELKVEHGGKFGACRVVAEQGIVATKNFAEDKEIRLALGLGVVENGRDKLLPEFEVDMFDRVDTEAVDVVVGDPIFVNLDHAIDHVGMLREKIVEAKEVTVQRIFTAETGIATVVIVDRVVKPGRDFQIGIRRVVEDGGVGETALGIQGREAVGARVVAVVKGRAGRIFIGKVRLIAIAKGAFLIGENIGGVVGDNVEEDLDAAAVGLCDQGLQLGIGAKVGVELGHIGVPVTVVAGRDIGSGALDWVVLKDRRHPNRSDAQIGQIIEFTREAGQVTAVEKAFIGGIEAIL